MRDTYLINGIERRRNANEKSAYYTIRDTLTGELLFKTKDEKQIAQALNRLRASGHRLLTVG